MYVPVTCLLLLLALSGEGSSGNSKANVDKRNKAVKLMDLGSGEVKRKPKITSLTYENCGGSKDPGNLVTLKLRHDSDGDLVITATASTSLKLEPPIRMNNVLFKKVMGVWVKMPCFSDVFGSCKIPNICDYGLDECPFKPLEDNNIPCQCPIAEGEYGFELAEFPMPKTRFIDALTGSYKGKVDIYMKNGKRLACYNGTMTVE